MAVDFLSFRSIHSFHFICTQCNLIIEWAVITLFSYVCILDTSLFKWKICIFSPLQEWFLPFIIFFALQKFLRWIKSRLSVLWVFIKKLVQKIKSEVHFMFVLMYYGSNLFSMLILNLFFYALVSFSFWVVLVAFQYILKAKHLATFVTFGSFLFAVFLGSFC